MHASDRRRETLNPRLPPRKLSFGQDMEYLKVEALDRFTGQEAKEGDFNTVIREGVSRKAKIVQYQVEFPEIDVPENFPERAW